MTFTLPADEFAEATQKAYLKLRGRVNVPGFRKGHAPRKLIERMYGPDIFYEEAINQWLPEHYDAAIEKAQHTTEDEAQAAAYKEAEKILSDTAANVYIQDLADFVVLNPEFTGYAFYPLYAVDFAKIRPAG